MAKSRPRKAANGAARVVESAVTRGNPPETVTDRDIARRAFEIYLERGSRHGHDLDDWLQAERELRTPANIGAVA
jgi:hypothetical protein